MTTPSLSRYNLRAFMFYELASVIFLVLCSLSPLIFQRTVDGAFYVSFVLAVAAGSMHLKFLNRMFYVSAQSFRIAAFLSLIPILTSLLIAGIVYYFLLLPYAFLSFMAGFVIPLVIYLAYASFIGIPSVEYKSWSYPHLDPGADDGNQNGVTQIIQLVLNKQPDASIQTSFTLNAPVSMPLGDLFLNFVHQYNKSHSNQQILYADERNRRFSWLFFVKRGLLLQKAFIDPDNSVVENGVRQNEIIYAIRTKENIENTENSFHAENMQATVAH